jgi:hypothetical protein
MTDNQRAVAAMDALAKAAKQVADCYRHHTREIPPHGANHALKIVAYQAVQSITKAANALGGDAAYIENIKLEEAVNAAFFDASEYWIPLGGHDETHFEEA